VIQQQAVLVAEEKRAIQNVEEKTIIVTGLNLEEPGARGVLQVVFHSAKLQRDVQMLGKMSPYVKLHFDGDSIHGKNHHHGGKEPVWNQTFHFPINSKTEKEKLHVKAMDSNITLDTEIGSADLLIESLLTSNHTAVDRQLEILHDGKNAGLISITTTYFPALLVIVHHGKELLDVQTLGKQDPYCKWTFGGVTHSGKEVNGGGRNPNFNHQAFYFNPSYYGSGKKYKEAIQLDEPFKHDKNASLMEALFECQVEDKNVLSDTLIGTVNFTFEKAVAMAASHATTDLPLQRKDSKAAGALGVSIRW